MQAANANELMLDPLAGCLPIMQFPGNVENFVSSLVLRIQVCRTRKIGEELEVQIRKEAKHAGIERGEYLVNELLHELRMAMIEKNPSFEELVLKNWTKTAIVKYGEDVGLKLFEFVRSNRQKRLLIINK